MKPLSLHHAPALQIQLGFRPHQECTDLERVQRVFEEDQSAKQRATTLLVSLTQQVLPSAGVALRLPPVRRFVLSMDGLVREALVP